MLKTMKKWMTLLTCAVLLCAAIPVSVFAADGNVLSNGSFDSGVHGWTASQGTTAKPENGAMFVDFNEDWGFVRTDITLKKNTTYVLTFDGKTNSARYVNVKLNKPDWTGTVYEQGFEFTSEWKPYTWTFHSGNYGDLMFFFQSAHPGSDGQEFWVDNVVLKVSEGGDVPVVPSAGLVNPDFEQGDKGWDIYQSTEITADAAYEGAYGAHLKGNGGWGALLEQVVNLTIGKEYHLEFWYKINSNGFNWKVKKGIGSEYYATNWVTDSNWTKVSVDFEAVTDTMAINFTGAGNGKAEDAYVDGLVFYEKEAAVPGQLLNGSFEEGDANWTLTGNCTIAEGDAFDGTHAVRLEHTQAWAEALTQTLAVKKNTDYVITFYTKRVSGGGAWNLALWDGDKTYQHKFTAGENWFNHNTQNEWVKIQTEFNSGDYESLFIKIQPETATSGVFLLDYMTLTLKGEEPDVPVNPPAAQPYMTSYGVATNRPAKPEYNMLLGADFEEGTFGFDHDTMTSVADETAPQGEKSLYFCTSNEKNLVKKTIWIDVEPQTEYVFSTWLKGAYISPENPDYNATIGIVDEHGVYLSTPHAFLNGTRQIVPTAWDNAWHLRAIQFNSAEVTRVGICLSGSGSQLWLDDMAMFTVDRGVKYMSANMLGSVNLSFATPIPTCQQKDNLLPDASFDSKDANGFWSQAAGWRNGFLSFVESDYEYGTSMKYSYSGRVGTMSAIKWIDVEPGTDYTFSMSLKVLESGNGRLLLLDDKKREKAEFMYVSFDADIYDEDAIKDGWVQLACNFNTDVYSRIGIAIVDDGGEALIDNMRLFKVENADESVKDAFVTPPAQPDEPDHPNTGDSRVAMWVAVLMILAAAVAVPLLSGKKNA